MARSATRLQLQHRRGVGGEPAGLRALKFFTVRPPFLVSIGSQFPFDSAAYAEGEG